MSPEKPNTIHNVSKSIHKSFRILLLLPLVLAGFSTTVVPIGPVAAQEPTGDSSIVAPTIISNIFSTIDIRVEDVGDLPEDIDGWNLGGTLDPAILGIVAIQNGPVLNPECDAMGGAALYRSVVNPGTGEWAASELCFAGLPHPTDAGFVGSGVLVTIEIQIRGEACTSIDLDENQSFLRDIDGFDSASVSATVTDGEFCSASQFPTDFSGSAANVSHRKLSLGDSLTFHANVKSTGPVSVYVEFKIDRPDGLIELVIAGPVTLQPGNENNMHVDYTPPKVGFYAVSATPFWSEDGGATYSYKGSTETKELDFRVV
jgi:hypothetical protein